MAKIKVMRTTYGQTKQDPWPVGQVTVDYGDGALVTIRLPTHRLPGDDKASQTQQCCEAIERLAKALLEFVDQNRSKEFKKAE
jgi:predicted FMN-binding regulatory protein PaiB